jgi:DNA-binding ferritin-like protein
MSMDIQVISLDINPQQDCDAALCELMCCLNATYTIERSAHWTAMPSNFYADHLLFQRLYEAIPDEVDKLAEKIATECGHEILQPDVLADGMNERIQQIIQNCANNPFEMSLCSEECLLDSIQCAMDAIEASDLRKLGWEDLLGSMMSQHEEHVYLLRHSI